MSCIKGWISEVQTGGSDWSRNAVVWPDEKSAEEAGLDLMGRWLLVTDCRARGVNETPNRPSWGDWVAEHGLPARSVVL